MIKMNKLLMYTIIMLMSIILVVFGRITAFKPEAAGSPGAANPTVNEILSVGVSGVLSKPNALRDKAMAVNKRRVASTFDSWQPILLKAKPVMNYILLRAEAAGARNVEVGHYLSYDGFKELVVKQSGPSKQKLAVIAEKFRKTRLRNNGQKLTVEPGKDFDDEILLETGNQYDFGGEDRIGGRGIFSLNSITGFFPKLDAQVYNVRKINDIDYAVGITESAESTVIVAEVMRFNEPWIGSRKCQHVNSCLRLRPLARDEYIYPLSRDLFAQYKAVTMDKLLDKYKNLFELYVDFDGVLINGFDATSLSSVFPSGEEVASFQQVLCNPELSSALVYEYRQEGYNVSSPTANIDFVGMVMAEKNDFDQDFVKVSLALGTNRTNFFPEKYAKDSNELRLKKVYQEYVFSLLKYSGANSVTESTLQWDIWNPLVTPATSTSTSTSKAPSLEWVKDRMPMIEEATRLVA
jgi:hypothetical protein